jgi:hypothetical protein
MAQYIDPLQETLLQDFQEAVRLPAAHMSHSRGRLTANPAPCGCWQGVFDFASDLGIIGEGLLPVDAGVWVAGVSKAEQVVRPDR